MTQRTDGRTDDPAQPDEGRPANWPIDPVEGQLTDGRRKARQTRTSPDGGIDPANDNEPSNDRLLMTMTNDRHWWTDQADN